MKRFQTALTLVLFVGLWAPASMARAAAPLFSDKSLETAVREELKKGEKEELKEDDLKNIYFLRAKNKKIANLAGLEKCLNVELIDLEGNEIADLKPLTGLVNVQSLDLANNKIADWPRWPRWSNCSTSSSTATRSRTCSPSRI